MSNINFPEILEDSRILSPTSQLAVIVGLKGALAELNPHTVDPSVTLFIARIEEIGGEFIEALEYAGLL